MRKIKHIANTTVTQVSVNPRGAKCCQYTYLVQIIDMENIIQAKKLINDSKNVSVFVPNNSELDALSSAFSLCYALNNQGKNVVCLPQIRNLPEKYFSFFPGELIPKDFVISIKGKEVSELYYEKQNEALKIYLTLKDGKIEKEDIHFNSLRRTNEQDSDLFITIGIEQLERIGSFYEKNFKAFWQTPIINIDNHISNNKFGNVNLVEPNVPLCVILKKFFCAGGGNISDARIRTWLLAGIIEYSRKNNATEAFLENIFELILSSVEYKKIINFFSPEQKSINNDLFCEIFKRLRLLENKKISYAFLSREVFLQTQSTPRDLGNVLKHLIENLLPLPAFVLFWESSALCGTKGLFYSEKEDLTHGFYNRFGGEKKEKTIIFSVPENRLELAGKEVLNKMGAVS